MKNLFLLLLAVLPGCVTCPAGPPTPAGPPAPAAEEPVRVHLYAKAAPEIIAEGYVQTGLKQPSRPGLVDSSYVSPNGVLLNAMDAYVGPRQHLNYIDEAWDCDDIAKEWCVLTHLWWAELTQGKAPFALTTFVAYVEIFPGAFDGRYKLGGGHALGLLRDSDGVWWFVEPSNGFHVKAQEALFEGSIITHQIVW